MGNVKGGAHTQVVDKTVLVPKRDQVSTNGHPCFIYRAAIYCRVSSEEQRENQSIETQVDVAKRWIELQELIEKPLEVYERYLDDGVSGTIPLADRPAGKRLLEDA